MNGAVQPLISDEWLQVDTKANQGSGKSPVNPDTSNPKADPVNIEGGTLPYSPYDFAPVSGQVQYEPSHDAFGAAYPTFSQGQWKKNPAQIADGRITGEPSPYASDLTTGPGVAQATINYYPGHDAHSQMTDTLGWKQETASGRTAERWRLWAKGRPYGSQWPLQGALPIPRRLAVTAVSNNNLSSSQVDGSLPKYADTSVGGPGNVAYETPAPPQTVSPQQSSAAAGYGYGW